MSQTLLTIPHYRDAGRLAPFLQELLCVLPAHFSILVSDDGSGIAAVEQLSELVTRCRTNGRADGPELLAPLLHKPNTGKGGAVTRGWDRGNGFSLLAFADADGAVSAGEILRAERFLRSSQSGGADALFASRVKMLGRSIRRTPKRHIMGRVFATLVSVVAGLPAYDTQCGLKILTAEAYRVIRPDMQNVGFTFDVELCLLLLHRGCSVQEFPVDWEDIAGSKVNLVRDSVRMACDVIEIRRRVSRLPKSSL